jgi:hypothetical protein
MRRLLSKRRSTTTVNQYLPLQVTIHDSEKHLQEQVHRVYQHRKQIKPCFSRHLCDCDSLSLDVLAEGLCVDGLAKAQCCTKPQPWFDATTVVQGKSRRPESRQAEFTEQWRGRQKGDGHRNREVSDKRSMLVNDKSEKGEVWGMMGRVYSERAKVESDERQRLEVQR